MVPSIKNGVCAQNLRSEIQDQMLSGFGGHFDCSFHETLQFIQIDTKKYNDEYEVSLQKRIL